ncbi:MAG: hypothetical protein GWN85_30415, partial [Gemmatimonadetes bacterium]|nr:hypothetical protein [Gemmatimonadota bacterium]
MLDEGCGGDLELRAEVESLLCRIDTARGFLDSPPPNLAAAMVAESEASREPYEGRRLGPWLILEEIGRGGMSRVFVAERADGQ